MDNLQKVIIRIIQDYCFENALVFECNIFATYLSNAISKLVENNSLNLTEFKKIALKRKTFFVGNDIQANEFCKGLFQRLNFELQFYEYRSLFDEIVAFKKKMEDGNFRGYSKEKTSEDTLRCTFNMYLQEETFCEPRCAGGNCDIAIPGEKTIIETKLWKGQEYYNSGFPELEEYLDKRGYKKGYYIIFDYNIEDNQVIKEMGETFEMKYNGNDVTVIFIKMNPVRPSKKYKNKCK